MTYTEEEIDEIIADVNEYTKKKHLKDLHKTSKITKKLNNIYKKTYYIEGGKK